MKKLTHFALLMLLSLTWAGCASQPSQVSEGTKVLIIIRSYHSVYMSLMTDNELGVMIDMLEDAGAEVLIASRHDRPYKSKTRTINPDLLISEVDTTDFDAVILPCLAAGLIPDSPEITELVKDFYQQGKVIAAQHGARATLFEAGIIANDQLKNDEVLQIGKVITSGCDPYLEKANKCEDDTRGLIEKLIATLNEGE